MCAWVRVSRSFTTPPPDNGDDAGVAMAGMQNTFVTDPLFYVYAAVPVGAGLPGPEVHWPADSGQAAGQPHHDDAVLEAGREDDARVGQQRHLPALHVVRAQKHDQGLQFARLCEAQAPIAPYALTPSRCSCGSAQGWGQDIGDFVASGADDEARALLAVIGWA